MQRKRADSKWAAALSGEPAESVSFLLKEAAENTGVKEHIIRSCEGTGRQNFVQIAALFELYARTRPLVPHHTVEVGVSAGVSTAYFLSALHRNGDGVLNSIYLPEEQLGKRFLPSKNTGWALPPGRKPGWAFPEALKSSWDLRIENSSEILP